MLELAATTEIGLNGGFYILTTIRRNLKAAGTMPAKATAASTAPAKVARGGVRKAKPVVTKTSLNSPYKKMWTPVVGEDMQLILRTITEKFTQMGLKKIEVHKKKRGKKPKEASDEAANPTNSESKEKQENDTRPTEGGVRPGWTQSEVRKHLAIGINEVTKALERDDVLLVIVCKSVKLPMMTKHIIELSATRDVPACQLPQLSESVAKVLGLKSVLALGFRKSSDIFLEQVAAITPLVPPLNVPWLPGQSKKPPGEPANDNQPEGEEDGKDGAATRKRKLSESPKPDSGLVELQGLEVKKIVPNPNKKRKTKVKKTAKKK